MTHTSLSTLISRYIKRFLMGIPMVALLLLGSVQAITAAPMNPPAGAHARAPAIRMARPTASTLYVKVNGLDTNNCNSWAEACDLQTALAIANTDDEIWVAQGTYTPAQNSNRSATFPLSSGVAVYGGFTGVETQRGSRNWVTHVVTLSGEIQGNGVATDNAYHVVTGSGVDSATILDGFVVTGGYADGTGSDHQGAGVFINSGSPALRNITLVNNAATEGGGMYNHNSAPNLFNVTFSRNFATNGAGLYNYLSDASFDQLTFSDNTAHEGGAGLYNVASSPTLNHCTFQRNAAEVGSGGAMANWYGSNTDLTDVVFISNTATLGGGGAVYSYASNPTLTNVTFNQNSALEGGAIYNDFGNNSAGLIIRAAFDSNQATSGAGGAIFNASSSPVVLNSRLIHNSAPNNQGGAIYNKNFSKPTLTNLTLYGNNAISGYGVATDGTSGFTLNNSILWDSETAEITSTAVISNLVARYSIIRGGCVYNMTCGAGIITITDPLFLNAIGDDLRLHTNSPAVDAADNNALPGNITTDLHGDPRYTDVAGVPDTGAGTSPIVDMGAYEVNLPDATLSKTANTNTLYYGQSDVPVTYTIRLMNAGAANASGIIVTDAVPTGFTALRIQTSDAALTAVNGVSYTWQLAGVLSPGSSKVITLAGVLNTALPVSASITNTAFITSGSADGNANNNSASAVIIVSKPRFNYHVYLPAVSR
jgi:uncharacterized repeat protein (TIGR01451 family)